MLRRYLATLPAPCSTSSRFLAKVLPPNGPDPTAVGHAFLDTDGPLGPRQQPGKGCRVGSGFMNVNYMDMKTVPRACQGHWRKKRRCRQRVATGVPTLLGLSDLLRGDSPATANRRY